jgi:hypothetical protein
VHQLYVYKYEQVSHSSYEDVKSYYLPFEPTKIEISQADSSFILTSKNGVMIGNFPGFIENMVNGKSQPLEQPASDPDIMVVNCVSEQLEVVQAEFCNLNKNNVFLMARRNKQTVF